MMTTNSAMKPKQKLHQSFQKFKFQCKSGAVRGTEPVILEFLHLFKQLVDQLPQFDVPSIRDFTLSLFEEQCSFLSDNDATLFPLPLYNIINEIKKLITDTETNGTPNEIREMHQLLMHWVTEFCDSNFDSSTQGIINFALEKIENLNASRILTYGSSPTVESIFAALIDNPPDNLQIKVIDGCPSGPGKSLVKRLLKTGAECIYGSLNCLANELMQTDLVLLGASCVLSDDSLVVPRGSAAVVHLAQSANVPVLVAIKSYQFTDKVVLLETDTPTLDIEKFEIVPREMVSGLITDIRILPTSSAYKVFKAKSLGDK